MASPASQSIDLAIAASFSSECVISATVGLDDGSPARICRGLSKANRLRRLSGKGALREDELLLMSDGDQKTKIRGGGRSVLFGAGTRQIRYNTRSIAQLCGNGWCPES